jgi:hypothetical protein
VEYRVHKAAASQAEIKLDIESAGHWFGGGKPSTLLIAAKLSPLLSRLPQRSMTVRKAHKVRWLLAGHLMRQLWPLNRASLETGPFFPFDNGPNGVNTLVAPQWLTRYVLMFYSC